MSDDVKAYRVKLTDLVPDSRNANLGTERGRYMLEKSLDEVGAGRSIVADKNNQVPAGNKTLETAVEAGFDDGIVVETDGRQLVIVKRTDWDLQDDDPNNPARRYAYWDNRVAQVDIDFDSAQVALDLTGGLDLSAMFQDFELDGILSDVPIIDDGEFAKEHKRNVGSGADCIVIGFGRFAAPVDVEIAGQAVDTIKARWGLDPEIALIQLCEYLVNEGSSN